MILQPCLGKDIIQIFKEHISHKEANKEGSAYLLRSFLKCFMTQTMEMLCREEYTNLNSENIEIYKKEIVFLIEQYEKVIKEQI